MLFTDIERIKSLYQIPLLSKELNQGMVYDIPTSILCLTQLLILCITYFLELGSICSKYGLTMHKLKVKLANSVRQLTLVEFQQI